MKKSEKKALVVQPQKKIQQNIVYKTAKNWIWFNASPWKNQLILANKGSTHPNKIQSKTDNLNEVTEMLFILQNVENSSSQSSVQITRTVRKELKDWNLMLQLINSRRVSKGLKDEIYQASVEKDLPRLTYLKTLNSLLKGTTWIAYWNRRENFHLTKETSLLSFFSKLEKYPILAGICKENLQDKKVISFLTQKDLLRLQMEKPTQTLLKLCVYNLQIQCLLLLKGLQVSNQSKLNP